MLTVERCERHILGVTGWSVMPTAFPTLDLCNEAGQYLANAGPWNFWRRHATIAITRGQEYADLSNLVSLVRMIDVQFVSGTTSWMEPTHFGFIQELRGQGNDVGYPTLWAVEPNVATDGTVTNRLELYQTPSADGTVNVYYFGGWQEPQGGAATARIPVPDWMEGVFLGFVEAVAFGKQERDTISVDARINQLRASSIFLDAKRRDMALQQNFGQMRGGAVAMQQRPTIPTRRLPSSI